MYRMYEHGIKVKPSFSGRPHAPVNMADSMEEVSVEKRREWHACFSVLFYTLYAKFSQILEVLHDLTSITSLDSGTGTSILHTICYVYRSIWPVREAKPHFGVVRERSAHDCQTRLYLMHFYQLL